MKNCREKHFLTKAKCEKIQTVENEEKEKLNANGLMIQSEVSVIIMTFYCLIFLLQTEVNLGNEEANWLESR